MSDATTTATTCRKKSNYCFTSPAALTRKNICPSWGYDFEFKHLILYISWVKSSLKLWEVLLHKTPVINLVINEKSFFGKHIALVPTIILNSFIFCLIRIKIYRRNYVNSYYYTKSNSIFRSPAEKNPKSISLFYFPIRINNKKCAVLFF